MNLRPFRRHLWGNSIAVACSVVYGVILRLAVSGKLPSASRPHGFDSLAVMTGAFLFFVPFAVGYLIQHRAEALHQS